MRHRHDELPDADGDPIYVLTHWVASALEDVYDRLEAVEDLLTAPPSTPNPAVRGIVVVV